MAIHLEQRLSPASPLSRSMSEPETREDGIDHDFPLPCREPRTPSSRRTSCPLSPLSTSSAPGVWSDKRRNSLSDRRRNSSARGGHRCRPFFEDYCDPRIPRGVGTDDESIASNHVDESVVSSHVDESAVSNHVGSPILSEVFSSPSCDDDENRYFPNGCEDDEESDGLDYDDYSLMNLSDAETDEDEFESKAGEGRVVFREDGDGDCFNNDDDGEDSVYKEITEPIVAGAMTDAEMKTNNLVPVKSSWYLISADHPVKLAWDAFTIIASFLSAYRGHAAIRDRNFTYCRDWTALFLEVWFAVDIFLNFFTEHKDKRGKVIQDGKAVWLRYLTTWFLIDVTSFIPWGRIRVHHIVEVQKKRNFFQKSFFRTKGVIKVSRVLRGRHFKLFGKVAQKSKRIGVGSSKLLRTIIKYVPKYILFLRRMKFVLPFKILRQLHFVWKAFKTFYVQRRINVTHRIVISRRNITTRISNQRRNLARVRYRSQIRLGSINRRRKNMGRRLSTAVGGAVKAVKTRGMRRRQNSPGNLKISETEKQTREYSILTPREMMPSKENCGLRRRADTW